MLHRLRSKAPHNLVRSNFASKSVFSTFEILALKLLGPYNCHIIAISLLGELASTPGNILLAGDFNLHWNTVKLELFGDINVSEFVILKVFALLMFAILGLPKVNKQCIIASFNWIYIR